MDPDLFARKRIDGDKGIILGKYIQGSIHNDGAKEIKTVVLGRINPGHLHLVDIFFRDL